MTIRVIAMSDLHCEFDLFDFPLPETPDLLVIAGDTGPRTSGMQLAATHFAGPFPKVVIAGNHEFYRADYDEVIASCRATASDEVFFLEQNEQIFTIRDRAVRVLGCILWSDFMGNGVQRQPEAMKAAATLMNDFKVISFRGQVFQPAHTIELHRKSLNWLKERLELPHNGPTIVVTHHAPSNRSQPPRYIGSELSPAFASNLEDFILRHQPDLWIHGHTHWGVDYRIGNTRVYSNARGYPGEDCGFRRELIEL
jgi:Icc-related predicted phosphoesterase